jgi:CRP-like cAMP-binding protein
MATTRAAKSVTKPGGAARVSAKTSRAKKSPVKKRVTKKPAAGTPLTPKTAKPKISKKAFKEQSIKVRAGADARKATMDTTTVRPEPDSTSLPTATKPKPAPRPPRRSAVERLEDSPPAAGAVLIERVVSAIERELVQIDAIVGKSHVLKAQRTEAERRARTLASLARTLTEVRKLRAEEDKLKPKHDDGPEDIDEFRRALSQKLDRLVRESKEIYPGESDRAGDA